MLKKWRNNKGETILESLLSMLVITMVGLFLVTAITHTVAIIKENREIITTCSNQTTFSNYVQSGNVEITGSKYQYYSINIPAYLYTSEGYYFYEIKK